MRKLSTQGGKGNRNKRNARNARKRGKKFPKTGKNQLKKISSCGQREKAPKKKFRVKNSPKKKFRPADSEKRPKKKFRNKSAIHASRKTRINHHHLINQSIWHLGTRCCENLCVSVGASASPLVFCSGFLPLKRELILYSLRDVERRPVLCSYTSS